MKTSSSGGSLAVYIIATPIGCVEDIGKRAIDILSRAEVIIGEEPKDLRRRLKAWGIDFKSKTLFTLNEHTRSESDDIVAACRGRLSALMSDAGTPGFCDPGPDLVSRLRRDGQEVLSVPGPCSLGAFFSVMQTPIKEFLFIGFLPQENEARAKKISQLNQYRLPLVIMDTPYRLEKTLRDFKTKRIALGLSLSIPEEEIFFEGPASLALERFAGKKAPFIMLVY